MNESEKREFAEKLADIKTKVSAAQKDLKAQRKGISAGLSLMPKRIEEVDIATKQLPYPVSGTTYTAVPGIASFPANTWVRVQDFAIVPPSSEKKNSQLLITSTGLVRYSGSYSAQTVLMRVVVNGQIFPNTPLLPTGFAVAGGSFTNVVGVSVEMYLSDPSGVTNDATAGRENSVRTFSMAVWT